MRGSVKGAAVSPNYPLLVEPGGESHGPFEGTIVLNHILMVYLLTFNLKILSKLSQYGKRGRKGFLR